MAVVGFAEQQEQILREPEALTHWSLHWLDTQQGVWGPGKQGGHQENTNMQEITSKPVEQAPLESELVHFLFILL